MPDAVTYSPPWWTEADAAELDCLVRELVDGIFEHRQRCASCARVLAASRAADAWRGHRDECGACKGDAPLTFGPPCSHGQALRERIGNVIACPHIRAAIEVVTDWRTRRELLSRARWLRLEQERLDIRRERALARAAS